jgi:hypothetical protein
VVVGQQHRRQRYFRHLPQIVGGKLELFEGHTLPLHHQDEHCEFYYTLWYMFDLWRPYGLFGTVTLGYKVRCALLLAQRGGRRTPESPIWLPSPQSPEERKGNETEQHDDIASVETRGLLAGPQEARPSG